MGVNLHLLEAEPAERPQPHTLEQRLDRDLHDARQDRNPGKLDRRKDFDLLVEHFLDVGREAGVEL